MKKTQLAEYANKTLPELRETIREKEKALLKLRLSQKVKKNTNIRQIFIQKKDLARLKTLVRQKEISHE